MATKRQGSGKRATGRKAMASRRRGATKQRPSQRGSRSGRGARSGARAAKRQEAALEIELVGPRLVPADPDESSTSERAAERQWSGGEGVPSFARPAEEQDAGQDGGWADEPDSRLWTEAQAELTRRREEEAESRAAGGEFPSMSAIGIELALGALRLIRTIATAPLRLGLAFLRPRDV
jgi:hypothetical protein